MKTRLLVLCRVFEIVVPKSVPIAFISQECN
jgi:hypothetical protein